MNLIKKVAEKLRQRRNTNATIKQLNSLTDDELKDIGIYRGDIQRVANGILDVHRAVRDNNEES